MRIAVTGATGLVGRKLTRVLVERGDEVVALARGDAPGLGVPTVRWNADREPFPAAALGACDALIHLAGESLSSVPWTAKTRRAIVDSRVHSTRAIADAIAAGAFRPTTYLQASAIGYYGDGGEELLTEASPRGQGFLSDVCESWELASLPLASHGVRRVVLRFGLVVDASGGFLQKVLPMAKSGLLAPLGSGRQWMSWIHASDLQRLLLAALDDRAFAGVGNAVAPEPMRHVEFIRAFTRLLHRPLMPSVPAFLLKSMLGEASTLFLFSQRIAACHLPAGFAFSVTNLERALAMELGGTGKTDGEGGSSARV